MDLDPVRLASRAPRRTSRALARILAVLVLTGLAVLASERLRPGTGALGQASAAPVDSKTAVAPEVEWLTPVPKGLVWSELAVGPVPEFPFLVPRGRGLYAALCASCHGPTGRADGLFAKDLPRAPRNLALGTIRSRVSRGVASAVEVFRTITVGALPFGMPSYSHLSLEDRWALVAFIASIRMDGLSREFNPVEVPPPCPPDFERGALVYKDRCASCHGEKGEGTAAQLDETGSFAPAASLRLGPGIYRIGSDEDTILRSVIVGRPGTNMNPLDMLSPEDLRAVSAFTVKLSREGFAERRAAWNEFYVQKNAAFATEGMRLEPGDDRWDPAVSARYETAERPGCLSCHSGIAEITTNKNMAIAIAAFAAGDPNRACVVCHEGDVEAKTKAQAHDRLISNPGSLWVASVGLGCGKCHANRGALTSLMAMPLPEPVGGGMLQVTSKRTDPTGACGSNHGYRIQRAIMGQESGKVYLAAASAGFQERDKPHYTDFPLDDPDGPVPCVGSSAYKSYMARAERLGDIKRMPRTDGLPTLAQGREMAKDNPARAAYVDVFRKDCARCHLWGDGKPSDGERRSSGCSACHVLNDDEQMTAGNDPTVPKDRTGHPLRHELVTFPPEQQCNHCHTRGVLTLHSEAHQQANIGCVDCHTSIDVHGDGNAYPSIRNQVEIRCEDCHGTETTAPWDLPIGAGTKAQGERPRGTVKVDGVARMLTDRGNVRANWLRDGDKVVVETFETGERKVAPLLKDARIRSNVRAGLEPTATALQGTAPLTTGTAHSVLSSKHGGLACTACHSSQAPKCYECHIVFRNDQEDRDWLLSAANYDAKSTRMKKAMTPGKADYKQPREMPWGAPDMRKDGRGQVQPQFPGCTVLFTYQDRKGVEWPFLPLMNPGTDAYPPPVAPTSTHEKAIPARPCVECHKDDRKNPFADEKK